ncbi:hypothetical protein E1292_12520 [Nonomuraea deserti]|uniref:Uncharacterized protein n=1 Tax=Nonomuraea deserti TaxID=1848322 RepID=A0A4R4VPX5_9ACTN|nr:hypothetical protein [Nonomuraea deserti]TDD07968.1 hypothetical protein E1292_12520 [Nonomuraea deserti]
MTTGDELKAAVSARRDLGPDFEDAVVESFLDKMGQEIDRRVDERLATSPQGKKGVRAAGPNDAQRLALAIVSLSLGTLATLAIVLTGDGRGSYLIPIWLGIVIVNGIFNGPRGKG